MGADWRAAFLLAASVVAAASDGVLRSSSNHRLRHGRGEPPGREHRPADAAVTGQQTAAVGADVTLDCGDEAAPAAPWLHDGRPAAAAARLRPLPAGRLLIAAVTVADAGLWQCGGRPETRPRGAARAVLLRVYAAPGRPHIMVGNERPAANSPLDVLQNTVVTLTCVSTRSLPPVEVTWFLGQPEVNVTAQSRTVTQLNAVDDLYSTRSDLTLNVTRDMTGQRVKCVTSHRELHVRQQESVVLNVQYAPRFTVIRTPAFGHPILRGMRVNLTCLADANPPVVPHWAKDESVPRVTDRNGTLIFNPISTSDAGWYRCTAHHLGNNVSSYSFFLNVMEEAVGGGSSFRTVQTTVGAPVSLKCGDSDADRSHATPCWVRENPSGGQPAVASRGHRMHLDGATYEDTGIYTCQMPPISEADTERRARARSFFVKVTGQPMVRNISLSAQPVLGQPASMRVDFCADPPASSLLWVVGHFSVTAGHRSQQAHASDIADGAGNSCFEAVLHLTALRPHMVGHVTVVVTNARGTDLLTRALAVSRPSHVMSAAAGRPTARWAVAAVVAVAAAVAVAVAEPVWRPPL